MLFEILLFSLINAKKHNSQLQKAFPLSVGLEQMKRSKDILCSRNTCPNCPNMAESSYDMQHEQPNI